MAHIGHYQQSMALSSYNDPLMCQLFPSSLGEVALKWFNQLGRRTINSWNQMAEAFVARFITNSQKTREMDALLTIKLQDNETIKDYFTRFWRHTMTSMGVVKKWQSELSNWVCPPTRACASLLRSVPPRP